MSTPDQIDEATAEALLAGRTVCGERDPLGWILRSCRDVARGPVPPPRCGLAAQMAAGVFGSPADPRGPAVETANRRGPLAAAAKKWRRVRMAVLTGLAAAAAKLAGLSAAAKAGAGLSIALAGIGAAGAVGVLPDPAQDRFDTVVESVTGEQRPGPAEDAEFGERVSEDAKDGGVDGAEISEEAGQQGERHRPTQLPDPALGEGGKPSQLPTPDDPPTPTDPPGQRPTPPSVPSPTPPTPPHHP